MLIRGWLVVTVVLGLAFPVFAQELTWRKDVQPIVQSACAACHGATAPVYEEWNLDREKWTKQNVGPRMDLYEYFMRHLVWPATGSMMRRLDDGKNANGKPGNMFMYLGSTDAERAKNLQTIKTWLGGDAAWFLNRWETRGNVPGVTKEQLDKIKAKY
jgi:hypothetical protein